MKKKLPQFTSDEEERDFWADHDSVEYVDWSRAERVVLPNLKPSTTILRALGMLDDLSDASITT